MSLRGWADKTIPQPAKGARLVNEKFNLGDIARTCEYQYTATNHELAEFAKAFPPTLQGLRALFDFVNEVFEYEEDPSKKDRNGELQAVQALQSPAVMYWTTRNGDCKSFTVFIASVLHHMGLPVVMRMVGYPGMIDKHIYPVAILHKREVPLDVVFYKQQGGAFGTEKKPMQKIKDLVKKPGLYTVGSMAGEVTANDLDEAANLINSAFSGIPEEVLHADGGDITEMTEGQFFAWQMDRALEAFDAELAPDQELKLRQYVATNTRPAFAPVKVAIPVPQGDEVSGIGDWVKDKVDKLKDAIGNALKKLGNLFHKDEAKKVAPYFLYLYLTPAQLAKARPEVKRRHAAQARIVDNWEKEGKMGTRSQILASMATGFKSKYGVTPQQVIAYQLSGGKKVGAVGDDSDPPPKYTQETGGEKPTGAATKEGGLIGTAIKALADNKDAIVKGVKNIFSLIGAIFGKKSKSEDEATAANASDAELLAADGEGTYVETGKNAEGNTTYEKKETGETYEKRPDGSIVETTPPDGGGTPPEEDGDNTMLYLGSAALLALLLMGGKKQGR